MRARLLVSALLTALAVLWAMPATAQWSRYPNVNNPVSTAANNQVFSQTVSDGTGGAVITWQDGRSGNSDIYAQRLDGLGNALWTMDGVAICTVAGTQTSPRLVSDGAGGAIITWEDFRSGATSDIYAQRVDGSGSVLWTANGVAINTAALNQLYPQLVSDGAGGAIITWQDGRFGPTNIYAQRVDGSGTALWTVNGNFITIASGDQDRPQLVSDGTGGAIITWEDFRSGATTDIYAHRVDGAGTTLWTLYGVAVCTAADSQFEPQLVSDGAGGAIITWTDDRAGFDYDIYAQRLDGSGNALWTANGVAISSETFSQDNPQLASDGAGGAIITWEDFRTGADDIYCQRVDGSGNALWTANGVAVCNATDDQNNPRMVSDDYGGAIITWDDYRAGFSNVDIYGQRVDGSGTDLWTANGKAICSAAGSQYNAPLSSDGAGGAVITWHDFRSGITNADIYAQRIERHGYLGGDPSPIITEAIDYPDDQGGVVVLSWAPGYLDTPPYQVVTHYSVWMRIPEGAAPVDGAEAIAAPVALETGLPPEMVVEMALSGWAFVESVDAHYWEEYGSNVPTYGVYTGSGEILLTEYIVSAHTSDPWVFWDSAVTSGYSVDNLAPGAPLNLTGLPSGIDALLNWAASGHLDEDLAFYRVHRSSVSGFTPDGTTLIGTAADTTYTDPSPGAGTWYYRVTGEDVHGNEGLPSNETSAAIGPGSTISAELTCLPSSGTLPFGTTMTVTLNNLYTGQSRRISGHLDASLAGGQSYTNWRAGFTNVAAGGSFVTSWNQNLPALGTLVGSNIFSLVAADVTPAPYNQPPYPPAGDTDSANCTVTGNAP